MAIFICRDLVSQKFHQPHASKERHMYNMYCTPSEGYLCTSYPLRAEPSIESFSDKTPPDSLQAMLNRICDVQQLKVFNCDNSFEFQTLW